jgi:hypothetical protein
MKTRALKRLIIIASVAFVGTAFSNDSFTHEELDEDSELDGSIYELVDTTEPAPPLRQPMLASLAPLEPLPSQPRSGYYYTNTIWYSSPPHDRIGWSKAVFWKTRAEAVRWCNETNICQSVKNDRNFNRHGRVPTWCSVNTWLAKTPPTADINTATARIRTVECRLRTFKRFLACNSTAPVTCQSGALCGGPVGNTCVSNYYIFRRDDPNRCPEQNPRRQNPFRKALVACP